MATLQTVQLALHPFSLLHPLPAVSSPLGLSLGKLNWLQHSALGVISMYFHPHSTHSTPPPDTPGALRYHPSDHPHFLSLCHPPNILVSNLCLNSSDLGTSGPRDLRTSESRSLVGTFGPSLSQFRLRYSFPFNTFRFPFRNHCMYIFHFPFGHSFARPLTRVLGTIQSQGSL